MERVFAIEESLDRVVRAFRLVAIALSDCEGDFSDVAYLDECAMTPEAHRKARAEAWDTVSALLERMTKVVGVMRVGGGGLIAWKAKKLEEECTAVINTICQKRSEEAHARYKDRLSRCFPKTEQNSAVVDVAQH